MPTIQQVIEVRQQRRAANPHLARLEDQVFEFREKERARWFRELVEWPSSAEAARVLDLHPGQITRYVNQGLLKSNGEEGRRRRIDPASLVQATLRQRARERGEDDRWAEGGVD